VPDDVLIDTFYLGVIEINLLEKINNNSHLELTVVYIKAKG
jgi:hypothetical protein